MDARVPSDVEVQELRRALSGMAALSSLPALWLHADEPQIVEILAEALLQVLELEAVCISLPRPGGDLWLERALPQAQAGIGGRVRAAFQEGLDDPSPPKDLDPAGRLRALRLGLGVIGEARLYAVASRPAFPTESERLSLSMAANLAAVALERARAEAALRAETAALDRERNAVTALNRTIANERNRLRRLFEQAPGFMALLSGPEHVFEMCNHAYVRLAGDREFVGRGVRDVFPELEGQGFFELLDAAYASGKPYVARGAAVDIRRTPDGPLERRYLDFVWQPIFDEDGGVSGIFAEGHDVTEQSLAAEHRQLLVNELNHRVKNTLATVQSMAHQTLSRAESLADARTQLTSRLVALSNAHNVLTEENWRSADVFEIIAGALRPHDDPRRSRVTLSGPRLRVSPRTALALSMALHELATNAAKYGALSNEDGAIDVRWSQEGSEAVVVRWSERGGPPVVTPKRRGFGSRLLQSGLAAELGTAAQLDYLPAGLVCRIRAPVIWRAPEDSVQDARTMADAKRPAVPADPAA